MFLINSNMWSVVKSQVSFKLQVSLSAVVSLVIIQILALILSSMGTGMSSNGDLHIYTYSLDLVLIFMVVWSIIVGYLLPSKGYRFDDASFVGTPASSNIANGIMLFILSLFSGVTTYLTYYLLFLVLHFRGMEIARSTTIFDEPLQAILTILVFIFYIWVAGAAGYLAGTLVQYSKLFKLVLPVVALMLLFTFTGQGIIQTLLVDSSDLILILKLMVTSLALIFIAGIVYKRLEVRA